MRRMLLSMAVIFLAACTTTEVIREPVPQQVYLDPCPANIRELERTSVLVRCETGACGTGVVIQTGPDYCYVLTAAHMWTKDKKYSVYTFRGDKIDGCWWVDYNYNYDLGVMYVPKALDAIEIAKSMPARGSQIYTCGNKLGGGFWPSHGIYGGLINTTKYAGKVARASVPSHPGNSGGAVVYDCKLIGIVSRICGDSRTKQLYPNMLLFVPVTAIHPYLDGVRFKMKGQAPMRLEVPKKAE